MTASYQGNEPEGFEEHKPSGKKKGPSMKERLIAQRKADEAAAAGGDTAPEAPAPKKAAAKPAAKKAGVKKAVAKPIKRAAAPKKAAAAEGDAPATKRASGARRSGGAARSSSRRGAKDGDEGETGGRGRRGSKAPEKNMTPIYGGIAVVIIGAAAWFFTQDKEVPVIAQEPTTEDATDMAAANATPDVETTEAAPEPEKPKAEPKKIEPKKPEGPPTEAPRNAKGKQKLIKGEAGRRYPDSLYDPSDAAEPQIATFDLFGKPDDCDEDDWDDIVKRAALLGDLESGAAGTRAALKLSEYGKNSVPALINVLLGLDYSNSEGHEAGDFVQRTLSKICNGRNANWRYGFQDEPNKTTIANRRTVDVWYGVWAKVLKEPAYWDRFAGQTEAAKRAKKEAESAPEPEADDEDVDDLLDDL